MIRLTIVVEGEIRRESLTVAPTDSIPALVNQTLRDLAAEGYPLAEIVSVEEDYSFPASVSVKVKSGPPLEGMIVLSSDANQSRSSELVTAASLTTAAQALLDSLTNAGFPLAEVTIQPRILIQSDHLTAEVALVTQPGSFLRLNSLHFPGAVSTRPKTLARITRLKRGEVFSRQSLIRAEDYLRRVDFLMAAGPAELQVVGAGLVDLTIPVREKKANRLAAMAAYDPVLDRPVGQVDLAFGNLLGTGRRLTVKWESLNPQRRRSGVSYREPWLLGQPLEAEVGFQQSGDDSLGTVTAFQFGLDWTPRLGLTLRAESGWETFAALNLANNRSTLILEGGIIWERLDSPWSPQRGWRVETSRRWGFRSARSGGRSELTRDRVKFFAAKPIARELVMCLGGGFDDSRGRDLLVTDVVRLGGAETVRGYSEEQFPSAGAVWGCGEVRWRPDDQGYAGVFVDQGWRYRLLTGEGGRRWLLSYGLTGRIETGAGLIGLDVGWATGEPFQRGRLHVRFENRF